MAASGQHNIEWDDIATYTALPREDSSLPCLSTFPDDANPDFKAAEELAPTLDAIAKLARPEGTVHPTASIGNTLMWADEVDSTQELPRRIWRASPPHGLVVVARRQNAGRGRSANSWESPSGCLMFTTVLRAPLQWGQHMPLLQHAVAIAAAEGVNSALRAGGATPDTRARIKWPNDIYLSRGGEGAPKSPRGDDQPSKIGGILCQSEFDAASSSFVLCVGMGINVADTPPYRSIKGFLETSPAAEDQAAAPRISKASLLACILESLQGVWDTFEGGSPGKGGHPFRDLLPRYMHLWLHSNQIVTAHDPVAATNSADSSAANLSQGTQVRIFALCAETGALLASEDLETGGAGRAEGEGGARSGPVWALHPDGNSLDMMQGLLKHKVSAQ